MKIDGFEQKIRLGASDISAYNKMKTSPDEEGHQRLQAIPSRKVDEIYATPCVA